MRYWKLLTVTESTINYIVRMFYIDGIKAYNILGNHVKSSLFAIIFLNGNSIFDIVIIMIKI